MQDVLEKPLNFMHCVASRFDYPNYRLSELSLVPINSDNRRSTVILYKYFILFLVSCLKIKLLNKLHQGCPNFGRLAWVTRRAVTFVNYVYNMSSIYLYIIIITLQSVFRQFLSLFGKRCHRVRWSSASSFNFQYFLVSWRSSSSCLYLLPFLPVNSIFLLRFLQ